MSKDMGKKSALPPERPVKRRAAPSRERRERMQTDLDVRDMLLKGEEIVVECEVHWGIYWKSLALLLLAILVALFIAVQLGIILLFASLCGVIHSYLMTRMLMLVLTNKRVLMRYGILQVDVVDMRFKNIESIELERMLPGFLLGYSNVIIMGVGNRAVRIPYLSNGVTFRRAFNNIVLGSEEEEAHAAVHEERIQAEKTDIPEA